MKKLIAWVEIPTTDFERAIKFYKSVLQAELKTVESSKEKMAFFPSGEGAVIYSPGFKPSTEGVLVSLNTGKNLDETIQRIEQNGGKITRQKTKIEAEGRGFFALFTDSEGNQLGLYGD